MRTFSAALIAMTLVATSAFAAPLVKGQPAGVKKAQGVDNTVMVVGGLGLAGIGIGIAVSGEDNKVTGATSTGGTTP